MRAIKFFLSFGLFITLAQQLPYINESVYGYVRIGLYIYFGILVIASLFYIKKIKLHLLVSFSLFILLVWTLFICLFLLFDLTLETPFSRNDILEPFIPLGTLVCSYSTYFREKEKLIVMLIYSFLSSIVGLTNIYFYGEGFILKETYIAGIAKNQIGPILSISSIFLFYSLLLGDKKTKNIKLNILILSLLIINFACLIIIRNRLGLLAALLSFLIILVLKLIKDTSDVRFRWLIFSALSLIVVSIFFPNIISSFFRIIYDSFTLRYNIHDLENLSAGRISVYREAFSFLKDNYLFGQLISPGFVIGTPHNFLLNKLVRYGLIGGLPLILFYFYIAGFTFYVLCSSICKKMTIDVTILFLIQGIILSLLEYTYPFGPGVSQIVTWTYLGQYLKKDISEKYKKIRYV